MGNGRVVEYTLSSMPTVPVAGAAMMVEGVRSAIAGRDAEELDALEVVAGLLVEVGEVA